jgi:Rod binding domain-containing protein
MPDPIMSALPAGRSVASNPSRTAAIPAGGREAIERSAERFEAAFLGEMLRQSGFGKALGKMSSGPAGGAFSQVMVDAVATEMAASRRVGIAEAVAENLKAKAGR